MFTVILLAVSYVGLATTSPIEDDLPQIGALGALLPTPEMKAEVGYKDVVYDENEEIPEQFDAREKWPDCVSIKTIWDQGHCGSCWAVASASTMGDRYCVRTQKDVVLSAYDIMSCCKKCAPYGPCRGGYLQTAWQHWNETGVVTGGPTNCSGCTCYRYKGDNLFKCDHKCDAGYEKPYESELTHGHKAKFLRNNVTEIQREIMTNGPVMTGFAVYTDFKDIGKKVYIHKEGRLRGHHAVRVIGWGVQDQDGKSVPYWLVANSWGTEWADEGYFRILRGENHCDIEENMVCD